MFGLFPAFEGKGGPKNKESTGSEASWRGGVQEGGFLARVFMFCLFSAPDLDCTGSISPCLTSVVCTFDRLFLLVFLQFLTVPGPVAV